MRPRNRETCRFLAPQCGPAARTRTVIDLTSSGRRPRLCAVMTKWRGIPGSRPRMCPDRVKPPFVVRAGPAPTAPRGTPRRRSRGRCREGHRHAEPPDVHRVTVALLGLSGPRQLAVAGVTVYCHEPAGTLFSVHVSAVIVPVQLLPIVCRTP